MILPEPVKTEEFFETDDEASDTVEENKESYEEDTSDIEDNEESYEKDTSNITEEGSVHNRDYYRETLSILEILNNSVVHDVMFLFKTQMVMIFLTLLMKRGIIQIKQKERNGTSLQPKNTRI